MRQAAIFPNHDDVEDWELFFEDKSRRRAEKVRRKQRAVKMRIAGMAAVVVAIVVGVSFLASR